VAPPPNAFERVAWPTERGDLLREPPAVWLQPTAAGTVSSALFGSARSQDGGGARFHEGLDIAPLRRDRAGRALDRVFAVAAGRVGYVNRSPGNSNYGIHVVLTHDDEIGTVYTLYAHLAEVERGLQPGVAVAAGDPLGTMGNTPASIVPPARSHLHFEVGLISNRHFAEWFRLHKYKPERGIFNGWNLLAADPLLFLRAAHTVPGFRFRKFLDGLPPAFVIAVACRRPPDFFGLYPGLWEGPPPADGAVVLTCAENGLPLRGRAATPEERRALGSRAQWVLSADAVVLGRNGTRIVESHRGAWRLGSAGERWRDILLHAAR
jgi:hypothetical protein